MDLRKWFESQSKTLELELKDQAKLFKSFSMLEDSSNLNTQGKKNAELLFVFNTK